MTGRRVWLGTAAEPPPAPLRGGRLGRPSARAATAVRGAPGPRGWLCRRWLSPGQEAGGCPSITRCEWNRVIVGLVVLPAPAARSLPVVEPVQRAVTACGERPTSPSEETRLPETLCFPYACADTAPSKSRPWWSTIWGEHCKDGTFPLRPARGCWKGLLLKSSQVPQIKSNKKKPSPATQPHKGAIAWFPGFCRPSIQRRFLIRAKDRGTSRNSWAGNPWCSGGFPRSIAAGDSTFKSRHQRIVVQDREADASHSATTELLFSA